MRSKMSESGFAIGFQMQYLNLGRPEMSASAARAQSVVRKLEGVRLLGWRSKLN